MVMLKSTTLAAGGCIPPPAPGTRGLGWVLPTQPVPELPDAGMILQSARWSWARAWSVVNMFSITKGITALAFAVAVSKGMLP